MADRSDSDDMKLKEMEKGPQISEEEVPEKENEEEEEDEEKVKDDSKSASQNSFKTRPETMPTSASATTVPAGSQLTIFYGGSVKVFDGIPAEKVSEIFRIAAAAVAAAGTRKPIEVIKVESDNASCSPLQARSPVLQNTTTAMGSLLAQLCPAPKSALCKMQAEFPIARRHSLQRFLEKRRDRLVSKSPYPSSPSSAMKVESDTQI